MKQKTGRKLLSFLLALAMVVGLMPGMSLTAHAEDTKVGNATYTISDGVLTVGSGEFTIENWASVFGTGGSKNTPNDTAKSIKSVTFESGATLTSDNSTYMFYGWTALKSADLTNLTASNVTHIGFMFMNCQKLTSVAFGSGFDTSKVNNMRQMFRGCSYLTALDLSTFKSYTGNDTRNLYQMFYDCSNLKTIRVSDDWNVENAYGNETFSGCYALEGGNGTKANGSGDYTKAVIDKDGQPGYFTSASVPVEHRHNFTYSASGSTLTATCSADDCGLTDNKVELTLTPPAKTVYGDSNSSEATLEGREAFNEATGLNIGSWQTYVYYKKGSDIQLGAAPTTPGEYTVKVKISNVAGSSYTLTADYTIALKEIGLTWGEATFHYDGKPHAPTATATGLVGSDKCDVTVIGEQTAIGTYTATASGLSNEWYKLPDENTTKEFNIEGWLGTARFTIESGKAPTKNKMLLKATNSNDNDNLDGNYKIENGVLTVYSSNGTSTFTRDDWRLAFANDNFIKNYRDNITEVVFSNENETNVKLTDSAEGMFRDWAGLESIDFSGLDTSEVTSMQNMFSGCVSLTELDLSPLNTKSVQNMANMFYKCSKLRKITVGENWQTASSTSHMFSGCNALDGGAGTRYQALFGNYIYTDDDPNDPTLPDVDGKYAHPDGGKNNPGFFYNAHQHQLSYTVDPDAPWKITATCSADGCYLGDSSSHSVSISLVKPTLYVYYMDELNKKDGEYDKGASPFATLTMQNVGDQTLQDSTTVADPDGKISGISFSVQTFNDANTAAPTFEELTGATIGEIEYYEKGSDTKLAKAPTDAGTYTAKVTIGNATASVDYRIAKRFHSPVLNSPKKNPDFAFGTTEQPLVTVEEGAIKKVDDTDTSTFEYALGTDATTIPTSGWSKEIPKGKGTGPFYVFYRVIGDKNHGNAMESEFPSKSGYANTTNPEHESNSYKPAYSVIEISGTAPTPPTPKELNYNGNDQELVDAGSTTTGKMQYAIGEKKSEQPAADQGDTNPTVIEGNNFYVWRTGEWSDTIPQQKEPGVYYVWYRVVSTTEPTQILDGPAYVQVPLNKAEPTVTAPTATATYGQTLAQVSLTNPTGNPAGDWTWVNPGTSVGNAGTKTFKANFTPNDTAHYKTVEVDVTVTVSKADPTANAPSVNATYGQTLKDVTLTNPQSNTPGVWVWADSGTTSVGTVGNHTFKANFTPKDTDNYNSKNDVDVTVRVGKAANPATVTGTAAVKNHNAINLANNVDSNGATGAVSYEISGDANGCTLSGSELTAGNSIGTVIVNVTIAADDNYEALPATPITVTISAKEPQTISANNVTATYGDTGKITASVTVPNEGGGEISYAVKSGSEQYIAIDAEGNLTIKAVPLTGDKAYVTVTATETDEYATTSKEVTVTIKRANTTVTTTPETNELTYNGSAQELVTAGSATVGQLRYALGNETAANGSYSASIPTATNAGDYYVWYYAAVGDNNHNDSTPDKVFVKIAIANITPTVSLAGWTYGETANTPSVTGNTDNGTVTYTYKVKDAEDSTYSTTVPTDAGDYTVRASIEATNNCNAATATADFAIAKADPAVEAPTAKTLTYTGSALELVNAGSATWGTMYYAVTTASTAPTDENLYTTSIPTATDAGTYYVWYKVTGDANHNSTEAVPVTATISPVDKAKLETAITTAETYYNSIKDNAVFASVAETLKKAIDTAKASVDNKNVTASEVEGQITAINAAVDTAKKEAETVSKEEADKAAAKTVTDLINALPAEAGVKDKEAVVAARKAYDALTEDQKKLVAAETLSKLTTAEAQVKAAEADADAVKAVTDAINALPASVTAADKDAVAAARKAYDALTEDQKKLVAAETLAKLTAAEEKVKAAEADADAVKAVTDAINALPAEAGVNDKEAVAAARKAYDALTEDQKKLVADDVLKKLTTAEAQVKAAEEAAEAETAKKAADEAAAKAVTDAINALPAEAGVKDKDAVVAARAAYDALTEDQKKLVADDVLKKLTDAEAQVKAAEEADRKATDEAAAKAVTDAINALPEKIDLSDKDAVVVARAAYDALTEDQKKLVSADVVAKLAAAEAQLKAAERINISKCTIIAKNRIYTGKAIVPKVTVMYGDIKLKEGRDYTLSYSKAKIYQKVKVTVKGKGKFKGSRNVYFKIIPKGTAITKVTGGTKQFTVEWKKREGVTGYRVEYSLHEDFSKSRGLYVKGVDNLTATIRKPKAGRTYYVRVRTYVKRKNRLFFSAWSETVSTNRAKANEAQVIEATMNVGEELDLNALVPGVEAWESSDDAIATVSAEGIVKALAAGEAVFTGVDNNGELIRVVIVISNENVIEMDEIELDDLDLTDFEGGILDDFGTDEEIQMDEELELVLG